MKRQLSRAYSDIHGLESNENWLQEQSASLRDWTNFHLRKRNMEVADMDVAWSDGVALINLLEVLSGKSVTRYTKTPKFRSHRVDNVRVGIDFLEKHFHVNVVGVSAVDVAEGNQKQILGIIFLLLSQVKKLEANPPQELRVTTANVEPGMTRTTSDILKDAQTPRNIISPRSDVASPRQSISSPRESGASPQDGVTTPREPVAIPPEEQPSQVESIRVTTDYVPTSLSEIHQPDASQTLESVSSEQTETSPMDSSSSEATSGLHPVNSLEGQVSSTEKTISTDTESAVATTPVSDNVPEVETVESNLPSEQDAAAATIIVTQMDTPAAVEEAAEAGSQDDQVANQDTQSPKIDTREDSLDEVRKIVEESIPSSDTSKATSPTLPVSRVKPKPLPRPGNSRNNSVSAGSAPVVTAIAANSAAALASSNSPRANISPRVLAPSSSSTSSSPEAFKRRAPSRPVPSATSPRIPNPSSDPVDNYHGIGDDGVDRSKSSGSHNFLGSARTIGSVIASPESPPHSPKPSPVTVTPSVNAGNTLNLHKELIAAIKSGADEVVRSILISEGFDPTYKQSEAMKVACENGNAFVVEALLRDGRANPAATNNYPIVMASWNGHSQVVEMLLRDSRVDPASKLNYPIRGAVDAGHIETVRLLLADPRVDPTGLNNFCIRTASEKGYTEIVRLLIGDSRVDPEAEDNYSLSEAQKKGHDEVVALLREAIERRRHPERSEKLLKKRAGSHLSNRSKSEEPSARKDRTIRHSKRKSGLFALSNASIEDSLESSDDGSSSDSKSTKDRRALMAQWQAREKQPLKDARDPTSRLSTTAADMTNLLQNMLQQEMGTRPYDIKLLTLVQALVRRHLHQDAHLARVAQRRAMLLENAQSHLSSTSLIQAVIRSRLVRSQPSSAMKALKHRYNIACEIVSSEESYVRGLSCLTKVYLANLKQVPADVLPPSTLKTIFNNSEIIYGYNNMMLTKLKARMDTWYSNGQCLGDIFLRFVDFMKVYTAYVNNYNEAYKLLSQYMHVTEVAEAIRISRQHPDVNNSDLMNFLILPVQRLPRYVLLLKDLLRNTESDHADYDNLNKAVDKMAAVADYVNEKKRHAENLNVVRVITDHLVGYDPVKNGELASGTRHFIRMGGLYHGQDVSLSDGKLSLSAFKQVYGLLFNDVILLTTMEHAHRRVEEDKSAITAVAVFAKKFFKRDKEEKKDTVDSDASADSPFMESILVDDLLKMTDISFSPPLIYLRAQPPLISLAGLEIIDAPATKDHSNLFALRECQQVLEYGVRVTACFATLSLATKRDWIATIDELLWTQLNATRTRAEYDRAKEEALNPDERSGVVIQGNLLVKFLPSEGPWKDLYFTLIGSQLRWYSSKNDLENQEEPIASLSLLNCNVTLCGDSDRPETFKIVHPNGTTLLLCAESIHDELSWVNSLRQAIRIHLRDIKRRNLIAQEDYVNKVVSEAISQSSEASTGSNDKKKSKSKHRPRKATRDISHSTSPSDSASSASLSGSHKRKPSSSSLTVKTSTSLRAHSKSSVEKLVPPTEEPPHPPSKRSVGLPPEEEPPKPPRSRPSRKVPRSTTEQAKALTLRPSRQAEESDPRPVSPRKEDGQRRREFRRAATLSQKQLVSSGEQPETNASTETAKKPSSKSNSTDLSAYKAVRQGPLSVKRSDGSLEQYRASLSRARLVLTSTSDETKKKTYNLPTAYRIKRSPKSGKSPSGDAYAYVKFKSQSHSVVLAHPNLDELEQWVISINEAIPLPQQ